MSQIDCVYVAASTHDARYTRTCVASIRFFYPDVPVRLLVGGRLQGGLADDLKRYWSVEIANVPFGDYGWGFVKLEPLFGPSGETFLILDSDTVLAGPVLEIWDGGRFHFVVDDESQPETTVKAIYYDWKQVQKFDSNAQPPQFLFNTGQWFGTAGVLTRKDFEPWIDWQMPRKTLPGGCFKNGEQGVLNYVINQKAMLGEVAVKRDKILKYPLFGMNGLDAEAVSNRTAPPLVVHWAGMKTPSRRRLPGADLLAFFETRYYERFPAGRLHRFIASFVDFLAHQRRQRLKGLILKIRGGLSSSKKTWCGGRQPHLLPRTTVTKQD
jgi:hypothetical protein